MPETVSHSAQEFLRSLRDPALSPPFPHPDDLAGWTRLHAAVEADAMPQNERILRRYSPTVAERNLGGVPVLDVRPRTWNHGRSIGLYVHGGAYTLYSAASTIGRAAIFADDTGLRVISVDYTLAPFAKYDHVTEEVLAVIQAVVEEGHPLSQVVVYGDSSGGGISAAAILKMRDRGLGMPTAAVLISPDVDLNPVGDTHTTLRHADPSFLYDWHLKNAAAAYADIEFHKHPYASPVYGDYSKGFPPTLIQGGTKEILLSDFVRLYQALDSAGQSVKLDIYEGMPHNFASRIPESPEARLARRKIQEFVRSHIGVAERQAIA